jgi:antitoxin HicB
LDLTPDDNDTFLVTCPQLPEVATFGEDFHEARRRGAQAIEEALAARISKGRPSVDFEWQELLRDRRYDLLTTAPVPALTLMKVKLYDAMRRAGVNRAELTRRLEWNRESVDRLFRLNHASRLDQIEAAAGALGCFMVVGVVPDPGVGGLVDPGEIAADALSLAHFAGPWPPSDPKDPRRRFTPAMHTAAETRAEPL